MRTIHRLGAIVLAVSACALTACGDDGGGAAVDAGPDGSTDTDTDTDSDADTDTDVATSEITGVVFDNSLVTNDPIVGAQIVVDYGGDSPPISATTDADGRFSVQVPTGAAFTVTAAAEGYWAYSFAGLIAGEEPMPLGFSMNLKHAIFMYDVETMTVSGTIEGAPVGSQINFFGGDRTGAPTVMVESTDPVPFDFQTELWGDRETADFVVMARDVDTLEVLDAVVLSVPRGDETPVEVVLPGAGTTELAVTANAPTLDGVPLDTFDPAAAYYSATTVLGELYTEPPFAWGDTGYATAASIDAGEYSANVRYVPFDDYRNVALVILNDAAGNYALSAELIEPGATEVDMEMLDSPTLTTDSAFEPGVTISWEPVEGADLYQVMILEIGEVSWWILTRDTELAFPRFPEGFDTSIIATGGEWWVRSVRTAFYSENGFRFREDPPMLLDFDWQVSKTGGYGFTF